MKRLLALVALFAPVFAFSCDDDSELGFRADAGPPSDGGGGVGGGGGADASAGVPDGGIAGMGGTAGMPSLDAATGLDGGLPFCFVEVAAVAGEALVGLPAGPGRQVAIRGVTMGTARPTAPTWTWMVSLRGQGPVAVTPTDRPDTVVVPLAFSGFYDVVVSATAEGGAPCTGATALQATDRPVAQHFVRVVPPRGSNATPLEDRLVVQAGQAPAARSFTLTPGTPLTIAPTAAGASAEAYVLVTSSQASWRREGETMGGLFTTTLAEGRTYDVLLVPNQDALPPRLFRERSLSELRGTSFTLDNGIVTVAGAVRDAGDAPVPGARVLLRAGRLSSTIGRTGSDGAFELGARAERYSVYVYAPAGTALPDARFDEASAIELAGLPGERVDVSFRYRSLPTARAAFRVVAADGVTAQAGARVILTASTAALPDVGTVTVLGKPPATARGELVREGVADAAGALDFGSLPAVRYDALVIATDATQPPSVVALDLGDGAMLPRTLALANAVTVRGRLLPADRSSGRVVVAVDEAPVLGVASPRSTVGADGAFTLRVSAGRRYRLHLEPSGPQGRVLLGRVAVPTAMPEMVLADQRVPATLRFAGAVVLGATALPGATVQVFCLGSQPGCVDGSRPSTTGLLPLSEATTDVNGTFDLPLPDPALE